ncbi:MAG: glycerate kinase [Cytophagaceae bacterium]
MPDKPLRVVIAPDSFKDCMSAETACQSITLGILSIFPDAQVISFPMADGGEGTVKTLVTSTKGELINVACHDPLMRKITGYYGVLADRKIAVIEAAVASGIELLSKEERDPMKATSYGTGELILHAIRNGFKKIIVGLGGSAVNDCGAGMLQALGVSLKDDKNVEIEKGAKGLENIFSIDVSHFKEVVEGVQFIIAGDVKNPLCGPNGASFVFGPQKGADESMVRQLDNYLLRFGKLIEKTMKLSVINLPGAGAAGGMGAALTAFMKAEMRSGFTLIAEYARLEPEIQNADLVITAEGRTDSQTLNGKVPFGVCLLCQKYQKPLIILSGSLGEGFESLYDFGASAILSLCNGPITLSEALSSGPRQLAKAAENIMRIYKKHQIL